MRKVLLLILAVVTLPSVAFAQFTADCPRCVLGLWDDQGLVSNSGTITPNLPKDIFLGIKFSQTYVGVTSVEFSVLGMESTSGLLVIGVDPLVPASVTLGTPPAPADTTNGTGGINIGWANCVTAGGADEALVKISILAFAAVPANKTLIVHHKFPPSNPTMPYPLFSDCNPPTYTLVSVHGGCYRLNPSGADPCPVATENSTWSGVKGLFR